MRRTKLYFDRPARNTKYIMLKHNKQSKNLKRVNILHEGLGKYKNEGLSTVQYKLVDLVKYPLFTHILIDVGSPSSLDRVAKNTTL
jgi:hypothetical protein